MSKAKTTETVQQPTTETVQQPIAPLPTQTAMTTMAEESEALVITEAGVNDFTQMPVEWADILPNARFKTTIDLSNQEGKQRLYLAMNEDGTSAKEHIGDKFDLYAITLTTMQKGDGEFFVALKMSTNKGVIGSNSKWLIKQLLNLLAFKRPVLSWETPWQMQIYQKPIGKDANGQPKSVMKIRDLSMT